MKKLVFLALFTVSAGLVYAQAPKIGFKAGLNLNHVSTNDDELKHDLAGRASMHFGVLADFEMSKTWSFQPQLMFSGRGAKLAHGDHSDVFAFNSLEVPLNFVYKKDAAKGFFMGMGPSFGYNLSGKIKEDHESEDIEFGSEGGQINRFDLGLNALLGYQFSNRFFVSSNYSLGLSNWNNTSASTWRNNVVGISIGYFLKK